MTSHIPPITEDDIAQFLTNTPGFFERHAEVLASVQITSPHGARAVSLQERQAEMLREKIKGLEQRIMEMVRNSTENAAIANKVHQWTGSLLQVRDPFDLPQAVVDGVRTLFDVPQAAVRVWEVAAPYIDADFTQGASEDARAFASSLTMPFCGPNLGFEPAAWLANEAGEPAQSLALLPLRAGAIDSATPAFGLLVLGSQDPQRFDATMGTEFLSRMAELASAALLRLK
ncbi:hypothetical protein C8C93_3220 [Acidovorax sp. 93]|jgi:uncharacterized protein YigA (DUF484 family)|uniref:DUF484 family protein n=1 Tax=Acidovorax facilis TaxID=12917 RepID=A0ABV8D920_9BURK|nr:MULTISPECIES: DUF484 family protein [Acidovorax]ODS61006.1 MAG: hypothetical protein ABS37_16170 [Acidovorax sp. SCN 65-108]OGA62596.1 MAG: hypothetical protein A2710_16190 [Burkholderiales bacterium RIFCSPHIGHO2_01_FULL_64_960]OGA86170.1 MAG: hypothetical protein A2Z90_10080 [Burkholderiales bacterium GWA2_64_37]OGB12091.1 MAG: hypothetical protein A3C40_13750 [Burkholderiales bacterium RIFCSPHIGHO2_02_FULL_64_19]OGB13678.1 MAG: hypothetical protein A3E23_20185 [Burkholderiales bacterium R